MWLSAHQMLWNLRCLLIRMATDLCCLQERLQYSRGDVLLEPENAFGPSRVAVLASSALASKVSLFTPASTVGRALGFIHLFRVHLKSSFGSGLLGWATFRCGGLFVFEITSTELGQRLARRNDFPHWSNCVRNQVVHATSRCSRSIRVWNLTFWLLAE